MIRHVRHRLGVKEWRCYLGDGENMSYFSNSAQKHIEKPPVVRRVFAGSICESQESVMFRSCSAFL